MIILTLNQLEINEQIANKMTQFKISTYMLQFTILVKILTIFL
jgi:hypothetical protein